MHQLSLKNKELPVCLFSPPPPLFAPLFCYCVTPLLLLLQTLVVSLDTSVCESVCQRASRVSQYFSHCSTPLLSVSCC